MANLTEEQKKLKIPTIEELHKQMGLGNPTGFERFLYKQMVKDFNRGVNPSGIVAPASIRDYWKAINSPRVTPIVDYTNQKASFAGMPDAFGTVNDTLNSLRNPADVKMPIGQPLGTGIPSTIRQGQSTQRVGTFKGTGYINEPRRQELESQFNDLQADNARVEEQRTNPSFAQRYNQGMAERRSLPEFRERLPQNARGQMEYELAKRDLVKSQAGVLGEAWSAGQTPVLSGQGMGFRDAHAPVQDLPSYSSYGEWAKANPTQAVQPPQVNWNKVYEARKKIMASAPKSAQYTPEQEAFTKGKRTVNSNAQMASQIAADRYAKSPEGIAEADKNRATAERIAAAQGKGASATQDIRAIRNQIRTDLDSMYSDMATKVLGENNERKFSTRDRAKKELDRFAEMYTKTQDGKELPNEAIARQAAQMTAQKMGVDFYDLTKEDQDALLYKMLGDLYMRPFKNA